jgi:hypothetical protein
MRCTVQIATVVTDEDRPPKPFLAAGISNVSVYEMHGKVYHGTYSLDSAHASA